jgi:hypothetical protein
MNQFPVGVTSLVLLALLSTGMTAKDQEIQRGLAWLRQQNPDQTYEISLAIQVFAAAKDGRGDLARVVGLVDKLESGQIKSGQNVGSWAYPGRNSGDRSNAQFAVLGLREAQEMGAPVRIETWRRARKHWLDTQNPDGGWSYSDPAGPSSTGSMTVAGIATLVITEAMVRADRPEQGPDGTPLCCEEPPPDDALEKACRWLGEHFSVRQNPGVQGAFLYYLYGLERAGRFSGRRFFTNSRGEKHDWYREGAEYLVSVQNNLRGSFPGIGLGETDPVIGTSLALMFLSKGLAPVLINKLQYGPLDRRGRDLGGDWNRHPNDVRNLTQLISNLERWPRLLAWQSVDVSQATVADLQQAPILYVHGKEAPRFTPQEIALLKEYLLQGGFLFAVRGCKSAEFDRGFRELVEQMFPPAESPLRKLDGAHPVFRAEYPLIDEKTGEPAAELWGVDFGCRTVVMYSPDDISCLWDKWTSFETLGRSRELTTMITKATRVGVNVVAYVTGRELINKLQQQEQALVNAGPDKVERDLLQIAKLRYSGDWDAAPQALRNLLIALPRVAGVQASTKQRDLTLLDQNLNDYPIAYMHGRHAFHLSKDEQDRLRAYIEQGGVLFADACCGSAAFNNSFNQLMGQLFPNNKLKRIPPDHELFTTKLNGSNLKTVKRREPSLETGSSTLQSSIRTVEPLLEGIEIDGRFVVIYSKYDISCALERQSSIACVGYIHDDAVRLAVNIVLYAMQQ